MTVKLGDYVKTKRHGHIGRVHGKDHMLCEAGGLGNQDVWFAGQQPPIDEKYKSKPWIHILVHNGGSICTFEDDMEKIEPFDFQNPYAEDYF